MKARLMIIFLKPLFSLMSAIGVSVLLTSPLLAQLSPNPSNIKSPTEVLTDSVNQMTPANTTEPIGITKPSQITEPINTTEPIGITKPSQITEPINTTEPKE